MKSSVLTVINRESMPQITRTRIDIPKITTKHGTMGPKESLIVKEIIAIITIDPKIMGKRVR